MFRCILRTAVSCIGAMALVSMVPVSYAGTIKGVAVDLDGNRLPNITVTVTGGGVALSNANGEFTVTTPDIRPITLTLSGAGSQTVTVTNLDGTALLSLTIVVPALDTPCAVQCYETKHRRFFRRR